MEAEDASRDCGHFRRRVRDRDGSERALRFRECRALVRLLRRLYVQLRVPDPRTVSRHGLRGFRRILPAKLQRLLEPPAKALSSDRGPKRVIGSWAAGKSSRPGLPKVRAWKRKWGRQAANNSLAR